MDSRLMTFNTRIDKGRLPSHRGVSSNTLLAASYLNALFLMGFRAANGPSRPTHNLLEVCRRQPELQAQPWVIVAGKGCIPGVKLRC